MEFFKTNTKIEFMKAKKWTALVSAILFLTSIISLLVNGLHFGLDFTGGVQMELTYTQNADLDQIRSSLTQAGFNEKQVKSYGSTKDVLITLPATTSDQQKEVQSQVMAALPGATIASVNFIGPQVGAELAKKGALAMIVSMLAILIYIAMRFEYRFAVSAILALIHDPILILGMFSMFHIEFDLVSMAAVLTVIGYSLNDTIVVFDRVRENFRKHRKKTPTEIMDLSINQTLSRTIMTSGLTLFAVISLLVYGGPTLFGFALAMLIGVIVGTYSSIYVAGALALMMGLKRSDFLPKAKSELDDLP
ncbi:MAG: protein translocase subunit SecF [Gammaproteobacteria bacterium]|nr:protein translocase subunit SecF [Gammaproteobacteria bacterium]